MSAPWVAVALGLALVVAMVAGEVIGSAVLALLLGRASVGWRWPRRRRRIDPEARAAARAKRNFERARLAEREAWRASQDARR